MRLHPLSLALRALRGQRSIRGRSLPTVAEALRLLRQWTGQDFGADAVVWSAYLRANRRVYRPSSDQHP